MSFQFSVPGMTCGHCVSTITKAVKQEVPEASVVADLATHRVTVEGTSDIEAVREAIADAGYEVQTA